MPTVLVVDDDPAIRTSLERGLRLEGFQVRTAPGGQEALDEVALTPFDMVVLDVSMPDVDGVTVTRQLRGAGDDTPICMLSALDDIEDRIAGLEAGADDYLVKPFAFEELVARLRALLRRRPEPEGAVITVSDLVVDEARRQAHRGGRDLGLTRREFDLLLELARHEDIVLERRVILDRVWGYDFEVDTNVLDVFVGYLRKKLEAGGEPRIVHTVRGVGFVLRV